MNINIHPAVPEKDYMGHQWAPQQVEILNDFAMDLEAWVKGETDVGPRFVIEAVAGSGKTTIIRAMIKIAAHIEASGLGLDRHELRRTTSGGLKTIATAFNVTIATTLRDVLIEAQKNGFKGATTIGSQKANNTVNGLGYRILREQAKRMGVALSIQGSVPKYRALSRIAFAEWLNNLGPEDTKALFNKIVRVQADAGVKTNHRRTWFAISNSVEDAASILMDEGFNPRNFKLDKEAMEEVFKKVGAVRGVRELLGWELGSNAFLHMVHRVMLLGKTRAFDTKSIYPVDSHGKMATDFLCPRPIDHPRSRFFPDAGKFDTGLYAFWKIAGEDRFKAFDGLQALWPPNGKKDARGSVEKPKAKGVPEDARCWVLSDGDTWVVAFNGGQNATKRIEGKPAWKWVRSTGQVGSGGMEHRVKPNQRLLDGLTEAFGSKFFNGTDDASLEGETEAAPINGTCTVSFSDQIWLPVVMDLRLEDAMDVAFIDEVQDLSFSKADLVRRAVSENGAFVIVGDRRQSLYAFAGARANSMDENARAIGAKAYPLTTCYRGTHNVAASARRAMASAVRAIEGTRPDLKAPDYQSHQSPDIETWEEGPKEMTIGFDQIVETVKGIRSLDSGHDGMSVISRIAAPLGTVIKSLLREGIPVSTPAINKFDKDILKMLKAPLPRDFGKPTKASPGFGIGENNSLYPRTMRRLAAQLREYLLLQATQRAGGDMTQAKRDQRYNDECDMLSFTMNLLETFWEQNDEDVKEITEFAAWMKEVLFSKDANAVHVATVHRYKGEQADRVFIIRSMPAKNDKGEDYDRDCFLLKFAIESHSTNAIQEMNALYVAATRAKRQNIWVRATLEDDDSEDLMEIIMDCENGDTESEPLEAPQSHANGSDRVSEPESKEGAQIGSIVIPDGVITGRCANCGEFSNPDFNDGEGVVGTPIGPRAFCTEKCWAQFTGNPVKPEGYYGFLRGVGA